MRAAQVVTLYSVFSYHMLMSMSNLLKFPDLSHNQRPMIPDHTRLKQQNTLVYIMNYT